MLTISIMPVIETVKANLNVYIRGHTVELEVLTSIPYAETYIGPYNVVPSFEEQTLQTKTKVMDDDVTVNPIQVSRTSNPQGGVTVYIGGIING